VEKVWFLKKPLKVEKNQDMGLIGRKSPNEARTKDPNLKQFYLPHHSELMATKSVSKTHRR
jgi:hypothetical protein